jgi:molybdenum cofactor synthesis domain-containing protein
MRGRAYCIRVALLTISDRVWRQNSSVFTKLYCNSLACQASQGMYADLSGPEMALQMSEMCSDEGWPVTLTHSVVASALVPDEAYLISERVREWCDSGRVDLVLTSGGTGFGLRDVTPEAVRPLLQREAPGVAGALLAEGLRHTPLAVLSRPVVGTRGATLVVTLPGSVKAVRENMAALRPLLPRIIELLVEGVSDT